MGICIFCDVLYSDANELSKQGTRYLQYGCCLTYILFDTTFTIVYLFNICMFFCLKNVIDEGEYLLDSFVDQGCAFWYFKLRYSHIVKEIQVIKTKVMHIEENKLCENGVQEEVDIFGQYFSQVVNAVNTKVTVNFDQEQEIKNHLLGGKDKGLQLISIVGMPGLDDNVGSRIIFTSRNEDLCLEGKSHTTFKLPFLSQNDSWYLLRHNVFEHGECSGELEVLGKDIATKCQGLPLLVNLVAVLLRDMEKKPSSWMMFLRSLSSQVAVGDSNMSEKILEQSERIINKSYEHLPDNLKPCLLYCIGFPKGQPIPVKKTYLIMGS